MNVTPINGLPTARETWGNGIATSGNASMGKMDFIQLLIAQLQHQDPLNPADPQEFAAQLAQFSSLEQQINTNQTLETLAMLSASGNNAQASRFIGREIVAEGQNVFISDGDAGSVRFNLSDSAQSVEIRIMSEDGTLVRTETLGSMGSGEQSFDWDGLDDLGNELADGAYTYSITALDRNGDPIDVNTYSTGIVTGIVFDSGVTYLEVGGELIPLSDVTAIH